MSLKAHIQTLVNRHEKLEEKLEALMQSPSTTSDVLADIKRQKLRLKDEITRLKTEASSQAA